MRFRHQRQKLKTNCGPTCLAILARVSQDKACVATFGEVRARNCYSEWPDIRRGLARLNIKFGKKARRVTRMKSITELAIVIVSKGDHWVIVSPDEELVYDPLNDKPVTLRHYRRKPYSYLTVKPPP